MKSHIAFIAGLCVIGVAANAAPLADKASPSQPTKLTQLQLDKIVAGNPNTLPNGSNQNSNGASGAPGNSFGSPGQTNNPNPGK